MRVGTQGSWRQYQASEVGKRKLWLTLALAAAVCIALLALLIARHLLHPPCCDSYFYGLAAEEMGRQGFFSKWEHWQRRTYGYPWLVHLLTSKKVLEAELSGLLDWRFLVAQSAAFFAACVAALLVTKDRPELQLGIAFGLMANPLILVYVPVRLTEGPSITIAILLFAISYVLSSCEAKTYARPCLLVVGSMLAGFSMVVRPSNVALVVAWVAFASLNIYRSDKVARWRDAAFCALGLAAPLVPQLALNVQLADKWSVFPVEDLGTKQIQWGLGVLKYATLARSPHDVSGILYTNPFFSAEDIGRYGASLYLRMPVEGALTMVTHLFNSLNNDLVFPYVYDTRPLLGRLFVVVSQVVVFAGMSSGAWLLYVQLKKLFPCGSVRTEDRDLVPLALALTILFGLVCAQNTLLAVETRFGLFPVAILSALAVIGIGKWVRLSGKSRASWFAIGAVFVTAGCYLSDWMLSLARVRGHLI